MSASMSNMCLTPLSKDDLFSLKSARNCEYLNICTKFKNSLGLPAYYFDKVLIFATTLFQAGKQKLYYRKMSLWSYVQPQ